MIEEKWLVDVVRARQPDVGLKAACVARMPDGEVKRLNATPTYSYDRRGIFDEASMQPILMQRRDGFQLRMRDFLI